jgi:hypothetical protein
VQPFSLNLFNVKLSQVKNGGDEMCLPTTQVDQFYKIWNPLLRFVNEKLKIVSEISSKRPKDSIDVEKAVKVRDALWKNEAILDQFIDENPAQLSPEDLNILKSWKRRRMGTFVVFKVLKKHAIFISQDKEADVFAVKGLYSSFEEMFGPYLPILVETALLPFNDEIIADGLFRSYNLTFGGGIRRSLKEIYDDKKERGAIIATLLPTQQPSLSESQVTRAQTTNAKVLAVFQKHLFSSGLSPKVVQRDVSVVADFAQALHIQQPEPSSLRDFGEKEMQDYVQYVPEPLKKQTTLSLKRFVSFLRDTGRLDWGEAENLLDMLKR